jgi:uncharacterized lipoprotein YddW (UPF0748 family)
MHYFFIACRLTCLTVVQDFLPTVVESDGGGAAMSIGRAAIIMLLFCTALPIPASGASPGTAGAYVHFRKGHMETPEQIRDYVNKAADAGIQFLLPCGKTTSGMAYYDSDILPRVRPELDSLAVLIEAAHKRGLEVHPWVCVNSEGGASPSQFLQSHPELCMVNSKGERVGALDPSSPEARAYIASVIREIATRYEIDGISLDYVRYASPGRFCYCERCKKEFKAATGLDCSKAYEAAPGTDLWRKWRLWRQRQLLAEMEEIRRTLKDARPDATLSMYVWGAHTYGSRYDTCQDWKTWIRKGLLDWINPSGYVYNRRDFRTRAAANLRSVPEGFPTYITIGVTTSHGRLKSASEVRTQVEDAVDLGASGVVFFTLEYTEPFLEDLSPTLHALGKDGAVE